MLLIDEEKTQYEERWMIVDDWSILNWWWCWMMIECETITLEDETITHQERE